MVDTAREREEFVGAVMEPLGDDAVIRGALEAVAATAATVPTPASASEVLSAADRMRRTAGGFAGRRRMRGVILSVASVVAAWLTVAGPVAWREVGRIWNANGIAAGVSSMSGDAHVPRLPHLERSGADLGRNFLENAPEGVDAEARLSLIGDVSKDDPSERWKAVWDALPEDPGRFYSYALAWRQERLGWPADFVETGERLDPGNGWFRLMRGAARMEAAHKSPAAEWGFPMEVSDADLQAAGWQDLEAALAMPRLDDYREWIARQRSAVWPRMVDYPDHLSVQLLTLVHPAEVGGSSLLLDSYRKAMVLEIGKAGERGDRNALYLLEAGCFRLVERIASSSESLVKGLLMRRFLLDASRSLESAWRSSGDQDRARVLGDLASGLEAAFRKDRMGSASPADALAQGRGSNFTELFFLPSDRRSPESAPVTDAELQGGRLAEYAMYERLMIHGLALLLALGLAFLFAVPGPGGKKLRLLSARVAGLLDFRDRLWIAAAGVLLPPALYVLATRLPWWEPRGTMLGGGGFRMWLAQVLALGVSVILGTLQAIRWRLGRRGGVLSLGWTGLDPGNLLWPMALLAIPFAQAVPRVTVSWPWDWPVTEIAVWGMAGFPLLWLICLVAGCLFASRARLLQRAVTVHAMRPFVAAALAAVAAAIPAIHAEEKRWTAEIRFEKPGPENSIFRSRLEREYAAWVNRETLRMATEARVKLAEAD